jgi:hypothetical protein
MSTVDCTQKSELKARPIAPLYKLAFTPHAKAPNPTTAPTPPKEPLGNLSPFNAWRACWAIICNENLLTDPADYHLNFLNFFLSLSFSFAVFGLFAMVQKMSKNQPKARFVDQKTLRKQEVQEIEALVAATNQPVHITLCIRD